MCTLNQQGGGGGGAGGSNDTTGLTGANSLSGVRAGNGQVEICLDPPSYTVTYDGNGNTGGAVPTDGATYANGATVTVLGNTGSLVKTGYTFNGWNTLANGTGTAQAAASTFAMANAAVTLYAQWTLIPTYSVTYNGNGNTGGAVPTDGATYANGATVTVLGNTGSLVKTGYTYNGWNTLANGTGTARAAASTFAMGNAAVILYAQWTAVVVNGTCAISNVPVTVAPTGVSACTAGSVTNVASTASQFTWDCAGSGGGTSTTGAACSVPRGYNVTPSSAANGSITPNTVQVIGYNTSTSFTVTPNAGYKSNVAGTCGGNLSGTSYTTNAITTACTVDATFTPITSQASISTRQNGVTATLSAIGCTAVGSAVFLDAPTTGKPASKAFPYGLLDFTLTGCVGSADVTITYSQAIPAGATYYKEANGTYSTMAATIASNTVQFTLTDNGTGDADSTLGTIRDPSGLAFDLAAGVSGIPTLSEWGLIILSGLMVFFGLRQTRRRRLGAI
jgi:uncharacterized repeat protein (TIGR02543 family)